MTRYPLPQESRASYRDPMGMSAHVARLRAVIGHELIMLPSVSVLPADAEGRLLLVLPMGSSKWSILGGAVDPGESPAETAIRESREEAGVEVRLLRLLGVFGGPGYQVTYPNGDEVAYVNACYEAEIIDGDPVPDRDEISEVGWFAVSDLPGLPLGQFARALLRDSGYLT
jgi:ADP-ribose pyrophosphatase YjhB (NUDIX family)